MSGRKASDVDWDADEHIPLTGIRVGNPDIRWAVERGILPDYISADMAALKSIQTDEDPNWDGIGTIAARWPVPFKYNDLDTPGV